jgi:hypothetical protein
MVRAALILMCVTVVAAGCGADPEAVSTPTQVITTADTVQAKANIQQAEMALTTCQAQSTSYVGCQMPEGVTATKLTQTGYEVRAGDLISSFDSGTGGAPCHATTAAPTNCTAF